MHILSGLEYRGWWVYALSIWCVCLIEPFVVFAMFDRFGNIGEWTVERILLVYSIALTSFGLAKTLCTGFDYFPRMVMTGGFDRLMLRPAPLFVQVASSELNLHRIGNFIGGFTVMAWSLYALDVKLTAASAAMLALAVTGGVLVYTGAFVITSGAAFFTVRGLEWSLIFTSAAHEVTRIPADYMPRFLRNAFTFVMPMLAVAYYPAVYIIGMGTETNPPLYGWLALPAGAVFFGISMVVWRVGVRRYKSTGS